MIKLTKTGVGTHANSDTGIAREIYDSTGTGLLPIQADVTGVATFRVLAKAALGAQWKEIIAPGTVGFLQSISWVPYVQLEVTAGAGTVELYIAEK